MPELVDWVRPLDKVTVFATYASLGLGTLERAHQEGLPGWDLIVVDEAHRTSGRIGEPWAVVHDNARIPSLRRLFMTATPRLWQLGDEDVAGTPGELVASMEDDPAGPFGSRTFTLTLGNDRPRNLRALPGGVCGHHRHPAPGRPAFGTEARSDAVRGARLAALQTALLRASSEEGFRRTLVFHHAVKEAEAFAAGLPDVAAKLHANDPGLFPKTVRADWLCGDHNPGHRRRVLAEFAAGVATDGTAQPRARTLAARHRGSDRLRPRARRPAQGTGQLADGAVAVRHLFEAPDLVNGGHAEKSGRGGLQLCPGGAQVCGQPAGGTGSRYDGSEETGAANDEDGVGRLHTLGDQYGHEEDYDRDTRGGDFAYYSDIAAFMAGLPLPEASPTRWIDGAQHTRWRWRLVTARRS
ncbi:hypothetical protein ACVV2G_27515 [Streptomyces ziwulingensis]